MARVLYISYDGLTEPLGQSQIIAYLKNLSDKNIIHIISFEKPLDLLETEKIHTLREFLKFYRIEWTPLRYHKRPSLPATLYDIIIGQVKAFYLAKQMQADIVHVRSYIPALIALPVKWFLGCKILFDIRGFWADERVDGGVWSRDSLVYRNVKRLERYIFRAADHVVTLTEESVSKIIGFGYWDNIKPNITVIPTCADLEKFTLPKKIPASSPFIFGYVGSFGNSYMLRETMRLFLAILKYRPEARMIIINNKENELIRSFITQEGLPADRIEIIKSLHKEIVSHIQRMHVASAFYKPCFSNIARAPTKLAEYLGCGIPCVVNSGVGDTEEILEEDGIGVILRSFDTDEIYKAAKKIINLSYDYSIRKKCRKTALTRFSLIDGVESYRSIYKNLTLPTGRERSI